MIVGIHANMVDQSTSHIASALHPLLTKLADGLEGEYGGHMEHLWIDLELIEAHAKADGTPRHPFRFQKRVAGRSHFGLPPAPDTSNVGHFSVRPDFERIRSLPVDKAVAYAISAIYKGTEVLLSKSEKLGGFDANLFRASFRNTCHGLGFPCEATIP